MKRKSLDIHIIIKEIDQIINDIDYNNYNISNNKQILDLNNYFRPYNLDFVLDCKNYKKLLAKLEKLKDKQEDLIIKIEDKVYWGKEAYKQIEQICKIIYLEKLLSFTYKSLLFNMFKRESKVIILSNNGQKYACDKLKTNDYGEENHLLTDLLRIINIKLNNASNCYYIFISNSNIYYNIVKSANNIDSLISTESIKISTYKHSLYANGYLKDIILYFFVAN